jgi:indolepyruvate ferredoxin oxidoreductase beta subunit
MNQKNNQFNIVLSGVGGQGLITLGRIITRAAFYQGFDVKMSELHGLSQRGGSVAVQVRFGEKVFSPLIPKGEADLVIALEQIESLKNCYFASKNKTAFIVNEVVIFSPTFVGIKLPTKKEIKKALKKFAKTVIFLPATEIVKKEQGLEILAGIFILGWLITKGLLPLKKESILKAIKSFIPDKYEINEKAFFSGLRRQEK